MRRSGLLFLLIASSAIAQQPRLEVTPDTVMVDESFRIALEGLRPGQDVTIRASGVGGVWTSSGAFRADANGRVDVADPMRFIWSASGDRQSAPPDFVAARPWIFVVEAGGRIIAADTIWRRALAAGVRVQRVHERGLVGVAYVPADSGRHPAIIYVPGSNGGIPGPGSFVGGLASRGYVVLSLAYFNAEGLPPLLNDIRLEYFAAAADWLASQPGVDSTRMAFFGTSRGGELALLVGATFPERFRVIVANVPSSVVWPGLSNDRETAAWTLNGRPVPSMEARFSRSDLALSSRDRFLKRMSSSDAMSRAAIPVERIRGPILLFGSKDDQIWPSDMFVDRVVQRLAAHNFAYAVEHYVYEGAGHMIMRPYVPTSDTRAVTIHPVSKRPLRFGGTPEGQAIANVDAWQHLLSFLDRYLRH